jgi:hypothetical protein
MSASASAFEASKLTVAGNATLAKPLSGLLAEFRSAMPESPRSRSRGRSIPQSSPPSSRDSKKERQEKEMVSGVERGVLGNMIIFGAEEDDSDSDSGDDEDVPGKHERGYNFGHDEDDDDEEGFDEDASEYDPSYYALPPHSSNYSNSGNSKAGSNDRQSPPGSVEYTGKEFEGFSFVAADAAVFAPLLQPGSGSGGGGGGSSGWEAAFGSESGSRGNGYGDGNGNGGLEDEEDLLMREFGFLGDSIIC